MASSKARRDDVLEGVSPADFLVEVRRWVRRFGTAGLRERGILDEDVESHCVETVLREIERRKRRGIEIRDPQAFLRAHVAFAIRDAARRVARTGCVEASLRGPARLDGLPIESIVRAVERLDACADAPPANDVARFARAYICALTQVADFWRHPPDVRLAILCAFSRYDRQDPNPLHARSANPLHQAHHRFYRKLIETLQERDDD
jgi:hypothetical protein